MSTPGDGQGQQQPGSGYGQQPGGGYGQQPGGGYGPPPGGGPPPGYAPPAGETQWGGAHGAPAQAPRNGLGIAAVVLGIVAILLFWTAVGGIVLGIAAIVLGAMGSGRAKRGEATNRGVAIGGIVTGVLGLIGGLIAAAFIALGVAFFGSEQGQEIIQQAQQCVEQQIAQGATPQEAQEACTQQFQGQFPQFGGEIEGDGG